MVFEFIQKNKDLFGAQFEIRKGAEVIGNVSLKGSIVSMEAAIQGMFYQTKFEMRHKKNKFIISKAFRPYLLKLNDSECGTVYQNDSRNKLMNGYSFHEMVINGQVYQGFPVGMGKEGYKCPVYDGDRQIALIEKDCVVYNDLHQYRIYAENTEDAFFTLLFAAYMYVHGSYKPGKKVSKGMQKTVFITKNEELLSKYDPYFKKRFLE